MRTMATTALLTALTLGAAPRASVDLSRQAIERCKHATALLMVGQKDRATAFCVGRGLFVTIAKAVNDVGPGQGARLVLDAADPSQREIAAEVVRTDRALGLALLRVDVKKAPAGLPIESAPALVETEQVTAFGYPFGKDLAVGTREYPSITVSVGRVTSLRKMQGKVELIQLDASLNPGNSGGPVVNEAGQVVGVVATGVLGTAVNFAYPLSYVRQLLYGPQIAVQAPALKPQTLTNPGAFSIDISGLVGSTDGASVSLTLSAHDEDYRQYSATSAGSGRYAVSAPPAPADNRNAVELTAQGRNGPDTMRIADRRLTVAGRSVQLSGVREIVPGSTWRVVLANGSTREGRVAGLDAVEVGRGGKRVTMDLAANRKVTVKPAGDPREVRYTITVTRNQAEIARQEGKITAAGAVADVLGLGEKPRQMPSGPPACMAYDGFAYPAGQKIAGQNGGFGWAGPWGENGPGSPTLVTSPGLTFGRLLTSGGCLASAPGSCIGTSRKLATPITLAGATIYFSVLLRPLDPIGTGSQGSYFGFGPGPVHIGKLGRTGRLGHTGELGMETGGGSAQVSTGIRLQQGVTYFLVVRMRLTDGATVFDLYVNPTPGEPLPGRPAVTKSDVRLDRIDQFGLGCDSRVHFDEARVGFRYEDVAPVR